MRKITALRPMKILARADVAPTHEGSGVSGPAIRPATHLDAHATGTLGAQTLAPIPANPAARALWAVLRPDGPSGLDPGVVPEPAPGLLA